MLQNGITNLSLLVQKAPIVLLWRYCSFYPCASVSRRLGAARGHIKQCCWTLLCVNVYTALTPQPIPSAFMPFIDPAHCAIREYLKILSLTQSVTFSVLASSVEFFSTNIDMRVPEFHPRQTNWFSGSAEVLCKRTGSKLEV